MRTELSVIVYFYNEHEVLPVFVRELNAYLAKYSAAAEVIFVDDGSTDGSLETLKNLPCGRYQARFVKLSRNFGSHAAIRAGLWHARGDFSCFLPVDCQDPLELIGSLHAKCKEGYDIAFAARSSTQNGWLERFFSIIYAWLMRNLVDREFPEMGFDVVMVSGRVREELNKNIEANSSVFLQILTLGFRRAFVAYGKNARVVGKSKWTLAKKLKMFVDSFVAFSYAPIRAISAMGMVLSLLGFLWLCYIVVRALLVNDLRPGWPALAAILLLGFGTINISLGIIAEYVWRTLDAARKRSTFIVEEVSSTANAEQA